MVRLFAGIGLPAEVRERLAWVRAPLPDARWVPAENMHMTLRFIGEVEPPQAVEIDTQLSRIEAPAFELHLATLGTFGSRGRVRALWAGVEKSAALTRLQAKVEAACGRAGVPPEGRKFHPHITLARCNDVREAVASEFIATHDGFDLAPFAVEQFTLFSSRLGRTGSVYAAEAEYPLVR